MSVGIYDADLSTQQTINFKIEILKLSAYYKRQREIVSMPNIFQPERYTLNFFYKDIETDELATELTQPNVFYGGRAFNHDHYVPLEKEIELCVPDTSIYERYVQNIKDKQLLTQQKRWLWNTQISARHLRLSLDDKTVWSEYPKQLRSSTNRAATFIHDYNVPGVEGWNKELEKIHLEYPKSTFFFAYPPSFTSEENFANVLDMPYLSAWHKYHLNFLPSSYLSKDLAAKGIKLIIAPLEGSYTENDFVMKQLPEIFYKGLFLKIHCKDFSLIYRDDFFPIEEPRILMKAVKIFVESKYNTGTISFMSLVRKHKRLEYDQITNDQLMRAISWLQTKNPEFAREMLGMSYELARKEGVYDI